jgi:hypothetical protein
VTAVAEKLPGIESLFPASPATEHSADGFGWGFTLEDMILGVWEDLEAHGRAECPVCGGCLLPESCPDCGATLE